MIPSHLRVLHSKVMKGNRHTNLKISHYSANETIRIHSGKEASENIWSKSYIHNDGGDGVTLEDPEGELISYYFW